VNVNDVMDDATLSKSPFGDDLLWQWKHFAYATTGKNWSSFTYISKA
jgi:hypothetical protein